MSATSVRRVVERYRYFTPPLQLLDNESGVHVMDRHGAERRGEPARAGQRDGVGHGGYLFAAKGCVALRDAPAKLWRTCQITGHLRGFSQPPGLSERDKRHGTTTLFAALNVLEGTVIGSCHARHRHQEFRKFLNLLDADTPPDVEIHAIVDNYATHKHPAIQRWLRQRPRFHLHFIPTSASWLNLVEVWFAHLTTEQIRRGDFLGVPDLVDAIHAYIHNHNQHAVPFIWTAPAERILEKVMKCRAVSESLHNPSCVDHLISFLGALPPDQQVRLGLQWVSAVVLPDPESVARSSFLLSSWLIEARASATDQGLLLAWQRVVDALVVAGVTRLAPYSE